MNEGRAEAGLRRFLSRSPRGALHAHAVLGTQDWDWRSGSACLVDAPVFEIGSVGKTLATSLLGMLVLRGELQLDDPVGRFWPALPFANTMTLGQLASHSSGLPRDPLGWRAIFRGEQAVRSFRSQDLDTFLLRQPPKLGPAKHARYSNVGIALLGRLLERVCAQPFSRAVHDAILQPLGMCDTCLDPETVQPHRLVQGHDSRGKPVTPFGWQGMEAAGLWRSSASDMGRFLRAHLGQAGEPWCSLAQLAQQPLARLSRDTQVGLGWMVTEHPALGRVVWHSGATFGQQAVAGWSPGKGVGVVILTDRRPPLWHFLLSAFDLDVAGLRLLEALASGDA